MNSKSKLAILGLMAVLILSVSIASVAAQYETQQTTNITVGSDGTFSATESNVGISYDIQGTPGATGTVTAEVYNGNPQPSAISPDGVSLTHFVVITFNMDSNDFISANVVISYSDADVAGIVAPYTVYKWDANSNTYNALTSTVDTDAKTITVTLNSISDPLLAIGGATANTTSGGVVTSAWIILVVSVIIIVIAGVFVVKMLRGRPSSPSNSTFKS